MPKLCPRSESGQVEGCAAAIEILLRAAEAPLSGRPLAMITALVAGLAATVRPTGYALLPVLILMVLMARRSYFQY